MNTMDIQQTDPFQDYLQKSSFSPVPPNAAPKFTSVGPSSGGDNDYNEYFSQSVNNNYMMGLPTTGYVQQQQIPGYPIYAFSVLLFVFK